MVRLPRAFIYLAIFFGLIVAAMIALVGARRNMKHTYHPLEE